jgi:hypothetical protein
VPKYFWIYQRQLPRVFSATVISNAIVLGSLQSSGFPQPSTNETCITMGPPCPCGNICNFSIDPNEASIGFVSTNDNAASPNGIPSDEVIAKRAWKCVPQLGLDPTQMMQKTFFTHLFDVYRTDKDKPDFVCGRGIVLSRQLDGVAFFSADNTGDEGEGFSIEFGSYGQIRSFSLRWSTLIRYESQPTASLQEITRCIKAHKTVVVPDIGERNYFAQLRTLANAKKLTIIKITPVYAEWVFGTAPTNDVPCKFATPFAELEATADFGTSNATVRLVSPILLSDVNRLLAVK